MAVKTITLDLEAYDLLARRKRAGQSFSQVVKEHFGRTKTGRDLLEALPQVALSPEALDAVEGQIERRRADAARAARR
jgi:predicted CopG family antitoxin